ncbi:Lrp/AsnC family transcriptional regulator [Candidatus Woesearchaeota archaeon]|nr:Lrp/AsnC family transcriptional regulator [Candidatus Woesearchaeota archaeon]
MRGLLDKKDHHILEILKDHGEYTTRQIAKKTLLPITTVHNRVRKLKEEGFIKRYTIIPDYAKLEKNFVAYILASVDISLLKSKKKSQYDVVDDLKRFEFVERVDIVAGGTDLVVIVRVKDVDEFDKCLLTKLQLVEGVEKTQSLIVIHSKH